MLINVEKKETHLKVPALPCQGQNATPPQSHACTLGFPRLGHGDPLPHSPGLGAAGQGLTPCALDGSESAEWVPEGLGAAAR